MAAFSEPTSFLERRVALLTGRRRMRRRTAGVLIATAITAVAVACSIPAPDAPAPDAIVRPQPADQAAAPDPTQAGSTSLGTAAADTIPRALRNPTFTPYEVRPEILDRTETTELIRSAYPAALREAGVGGTTVLWVFVDASGAVRATRVATSSGHPQLDAAAEAAMLQVRFTPAMNRGEPVPVWIQLPVTFTDRRGR